MPEYYIQPVTNRQECYTCHKVVKGKKKLSKCAKCHAITYCSKECQKEDWPRHGWNCVPVMVTEIPGKGRGIVAARDIKMGELIFIDKPVIEVNGTELKKNRKSEAMSVMKKIENLPSEAKLQFYLLKGSGDKSYKDLLSSVGDVEAALGITIKNARVLNQQDLSRSLYLNVALVNHSCAPNSDYGRIIEKDENGKLYNRMETRAIKHISKGEEITYCYFGDINKLCIQSQIRKMFVKNDFGFDCNCCVCSEPDADQEKIAMELFDHFQYLGTTDHYRKDLSEWARDAERLDQINDLFQEFKLGNLEVKWRSMISLAKTAQLARNLDLVRKGLDMLKRFCEDIQIEEIGLVYEKLEKDLTLWSNNLISKETPKRNEIKFFLQRNLLSEVGQRTLHVEM